MSSTTPKPSRIAPLLVGLVLGVLLTGAAVWTVMPSLMLQVHESRFADVDTTSQELKKAAEAAGWSVPAIRDMNASMAKQGVQHESPVRIVELCNAPYAHEVLSDNPEVSTLIVGISAG